MIRRCAALPVLSLLALALTVASNLRAQNDGPGPALHGTVEGRLYVAPGEVFKVTIPVLPELGGHLTDTPNVVTFQDGFNTHISIAAFPHDATQRWELSTRGLQDYLIYFFTNFVMADFGQVFAGVRNESAKFGPVRGVADGGLIAYLMTPGGSMFADKVPHLAVGSQMPVAKRGNLLFVKNGHTFVISTELAERVIEGKAYSKTTAEEDELLLQRLEDTVAKIQFAKPPSVAAAHDAKR